MGSCPDTNINPKFRPKSVLEQFYFFYIYVYMCIFICIYMYIYICIYMCINVGVESTLA